MVPISIIKNNNRIGCNVEMMKSLYKTLTETIDIGAHCRQLVLNQDKNKNIKNIDIEERYKILKHCLEKNKTFYIHLPCNINLAQDPNDYRINKSLKIIDQSLKVIKDLPAAGILHLGYSVKRNIDQAYNDLIEQLNNLKLEVKSDYKVPESILLENSAGQGTAMGKSWSELRRIFEGLDNSGIGLCIDTQHAFASGMSKLETHQDIENLFDNAEDIIGKSGIRLIHLNDSMVEYGSRIDRHQNIRRGYIWYHNDEGLKSLLNRCFEDSIDVILETPQKYIYNDLDYIRHTYI